MSMPSCVTVAPIIRLPIKGLISSQRDWDPAGPLGLKLQPELFHQVFKKNPGLSASVRSRPDIGLVLPSLQSTVVELWRYNDSATTSATRSDFGRLSLRGRNIVALRVRHWDGATETVNRLYDLNKWYLRDQ